MAKNDTAPQNIDKEKKDASTDKTTGEQGAIPNPFEDGNSKLTPEQEENIEQFKEAQTERD